MSPETCYPLPMPPYWLGLLLFGLSMFYLGVSIEWFIRTLLRKRPHG